MRREGANIQSDSTAGSKDVTAAFTQTRTPGGSTAQGAESDIYDRLVNKALIDRRLGPRCYRLIRLREVVPCVSRLQLVFLRAVYRQAEGCV